MSLAVAPTWRQRIEGEIARLEEQNQRRREQMTADMEAVLSKHQLHIDNLRARIDNGEFG